MFLLQAIEKYCQFPPSGSNPISVTTEDYYCLEDESFLNDVIIDFFFKWLQFDLISPEDRDRTHIFSTFFYNRLTTRPQMQVLHSSKVKLRKSPLTLNLLLKLAVKKWCTFGIWIPDVQLPETSYYHTFVSPLSRYSRSITWSEYQTFSTVL